MFFLFHKQIHEISPGAIQKSDGLKVTCLMSLYFKFEEDTMKNEIPEIIFVIIFPEFFQLYNNRQNFIHHISDLFEH